MPFFDCDGILANFHYLKCYGKCVEKEIKPTIYRNEMANCIDQNVFDRKMFECFRCLTFDSDSVKTDIRLKMLWSIGIIYFYHD